MDGKRLTRFASKWVERSTPSLLAKAFRVELVGQDADDESADEVKP
jgi:hypothetical protein